MNKRSGLFIALMLLGGSQAAAAQFGVLPAVGGIVRRTEETLDSVTRPVLDTVRDAATLADERLANLRTFVSANRKTVELDDTGQAARAHEVLLLDPDLAALARASASGYRLIETGDLNGLGVDYARLVTPPGASLASATRQLRRLLPGKQISADQIHFSAGTIAGGTPGGAPDSLPTPTGGTVGIIDGAALPGPRIAAQAGFASGAPRPDVHAQAIASLLGGAGVARIYSADVYGTDPAGGNALAIGKALGWMSMNHVPVVSISLVGPANPLLARAIAAVQAKQMIVTAAVGNNGAAAPPAYPASYAGVLAVTGIDGHGRVLFEAGRASHLDYAAPGADLTAIDLAGKRQALRGTSFAAPLVAARIAALRQDGAEPVAVLRRADAEAVKKGARTGRGVLCGVCRRGI